MLLRLLIVILLATTATLSQTPQVEPGVSQTLAKWRAARYSDVRYKLNLTLEKMSPVLKGTIEIRVKVGTRTPSSATPQSGEIPAIILDWRKIRGHEALSTISNVSVNGKAVESQSPQAAIADGGVRVPFEESNEHLIFRDGVVAGENVIRLDFTSPILTSGSAITRYVDKEDGAEYIYSLFVPSDASTAFPVFDQPDLKARFQLDVLAPNEWKVLSNSIGEQFRVKAVEPGSRKPDVDPPHSIGRILRGVSWQNFEETKPISTYVFAFAAGDFAQVSEPSAVAGGLTPQPSNSDNRGSSKSIGSNNKLQPPATAGGSDKAAELPTSIYVRKSQAAKFKPHAAEVFRLNREGIKYLETYFDYKFPFPKYDLVLIPEFPFGGMEHAGATFLREDRVIFPTEPTKNDYITRANLIFHEAAHQWFGDTVTMRWFDDLWLKEGFAEFMAYKTLEKVMPQYNAWKIFYERNKQAAYLTDSTKGTTPIYQEITNLNAAKSAYGNIVYRKAPSFLKQAEFYLGKEDFQKAVRAFLKKYEFANAGWSDLVDEFSEATLPKINTQSSYLSLASAEKKKLDDSVRKEISNWGENWIKRSGVLIFRNRLAAGVPFRGNLISINNSPQFEFVQKEKSDMLASLPMRVNLMVRYRDETVFQSTRVVPNEKIVLVAPENFFTSRFRAGETLLPAFVFPNHQDYGYGIFLLDDKSRDYVLNNIHNEKDDFLRTMMWGSLWDRVREAELDPKDYVGLVVKNLAVQSAGLSPSERDKSRTPNFGETDESTIQTLLARVSTAMTYYLSEPSAVAGGLTLSVRNIGKQGSDKPAPSYDQLQPSTTPGGSDLAARLESVLIERMRNAPTLGQRITFYRAFLNIASTENALEILKRMLKGSEPFALAGGPERATESWSRTETTVANAAGNPPANAGGSDMKTNVANAAKNPPANAGGSDMKTNVANAAKNPPADAGGSDIKIPLKTKDKFDIVTKLLILGDKDAPNLLADLEKN